MVARVTAACDRIAEQDKDNGSRRTSLDNVLPEDDVFLSLLTWETTVPLVVHLLSYDIRLAKSHLIYNHPDPPDAKRRPIGTAISWRARSTSAPTATHG